MSAVGWHIACTTITRPVHHVPALFSSHILITHQPSIACLFHCLSARVSQKSRIQTSPYLQWMLPVAGTRSPSDIAVYVMYFWPWASAHRGKWGQLTPWKNGSKIKKAKTCKKEQFSMLRYMLRAIKAGRCRERRYADHIFILMYFRMHHFVVKFSQNFFASGGKGH